MYRNETEHLKKTIEDLRDKLTWSTHALNTAEIDLFEQKDKNMVKYIASCLAGAFFGVALTGTLVSFFAAAEAKPEVPARSARLLMVADGRCSRIFSAYDSGSTVNIVMLNGVEFDSVNEPISIFTPPNYTAEGWDAAFEAAGFTRESCE